MAESLRVFYRKADNKIVWNVTLEGRGEFPRTVGEDTALLPSTKIGATLEREGTPLGGEVVDYACIEITDTPTIARFLMSDSNTIVNGKIVIGSPRIIPTPIPPRDLAAEIDDLKTKLKAKAII